MLCFDSLKILDKHQSFLQDICQNNDIFLVGGCVRDLLLGMDEDLCDIDFTMAGDPSDIYESIQKDDVHHFITEKFGTITLIPKDNEKLKYELTPLRMENDYSDNRHPEKINWHDDILLDSNRRDFSINSVYYFSTYIDNRLLTRKFKQSFDITKQDEVLKSLNKSGAIFYADMNLFVVQDINYISKLFPQGKFDKDFAVYLFDTISENFVHLAKSRENIIRIIIDPHHGIQDLIDRKIKCVGEPDKRFQEDSLRIVRALRFVSVLNQKFREKGGLEKVVLFDVDTDTWASIKSQANLVVNISRERIHDEIMKVFVSGDPFAFVSLLDEVKLLGQIFPAVYATKNIDQPIRYHPFDVYVHTMLSLYNVQRINKDYLVRLAMLYHDVGKVGQYAAYSQALNREEIRGILAGPLNHRISGPEIAKKDFANLTFSKNDIKDICRYILNHHVPGEILNANEENRVKKIRKLYSEVGFEKVNNLLDITIADRLGQYNPMQNSADITDVEELRKILFRLQQEEGQFTQKDLKINGNEIIQYFQLKPGPEIGELIEVALNWVMVDISHRNKKKEILAYLKGFLKNRV